MTVPPKAASRTPRLGASAGPAIPAFGSGGAPRVRPDAPGRRRGFTLVEALVALVVAGLLLPALARALGGAWTATRTPMDIVSGMVLARDVAAGAPVPPETRARGFAAERAVGGATVLVLPSDVAPAPKGTGEDDPSGLKPADTPSAMKLAAPQGLGRSSPGAASDLALRRITVSVRTPTGRRLTLEGLRLDDAAR